MTHVVLANAQKRLDFVLPKMKQHQDWLVWIVMNAVGLEQRAKMTNSIVGPKWTLAGKRSTLDEVLATVRDRLEVASVVDRYIPWLANRLNKTKDHGLLEPLVSAFRSICIWASETKTDLNKLSLEEALNQSADYVPNAARKSKEDSDANPVVYRFADGHKIVELRTDEALKREGDVMKHCVGSYCDAVKAGDSIIYSLRDPSGKSVVTMEYLPKLKGFDQIFGPSNEKPSDEVKPLVLEFLKNKYPTEVDFILEMGGSFEDIDLSDVESMSSEAKRSLARNSLSPVSILEVLARDGGRDVRSAIAIHRRTPTSVLEVLARDGGSDVRVSVADNPNTPTSVLEALAKDKSSSVRAAVAGNPNTPTSVLEALAVEAADYAEDIYGIRRMVARNRNAPASALEALSGDRDLYVRRDVADNPSLPASALERLATDADINIRQKVAKNPNTPASALERLVNDSNTINIVAANPSTPPFILEKLATKKNTLARFYVGQNPSTPISVLESLAGDHDADVRYAIARNPRTPEPVLEKIATTDPDDELRGEATKNLASRKLTASSRLAVAIALRAAARALEKS